MLKNFKSIAVLIGLMLPLTAAAQSENSQKPDVIPGQVNMPVQVGSTNGAIRDIPDTVPTRPARGGRDFEPGKPFPAGDQNPVTEAGMPLGLAGSAARIEPQAATDGVPVDTSRRVAPPDTTGDLGPNHYVQWVNLRLAVYTLTRDASGMITGFNLVGGFPKNGNTIFQALGGACASNNDGDPIVQYDQAADRWVLTQFSVSTTPYLQCVAVSKSPDPTGAYSLYSYSFGTDFNDFPKMGIWNDTYVITYNMFKRGRTFAGARVCGYERAAMLNGAAARSVCSSTSTSYASLLPADVEGAANPAAGSAVPLLSITSSSLLSWKFSATWGSTATGSLTGPTTVSGVQAFSRACSGGTCIPQPGTTNKLDSLGDRLNYRLSYRKFGTYESLLVNHAVAANGATGIRWYELRNATSTPTVYQQGTYAPTSDYRWMGSAAMDKTGGIAIGYNISSTAIKPSIRYAGRAASDPLGTLGGEAGILTGAGSQTGTLARWGDYSTMSVDPNDDCTMVFTTEYIPSNGSFNWSTYIYSFKLSTCQ